MKSSTSSWINIEINVISAVFTFRNVDNKKRPERAAPPDSVHPALHHAGVDADVDEGETQYDEEHDVLGVPPEHGLLAEEELVCQAEHEESETENLYQDLQILTVGLKLFPIRRPTVTQNLFSAKFWKVPIVGCSNMARHSMMIRAT